MLFLAHGDVFSSNMLQTILNERVLQMKYHPKLREEANTHPGILALLALFESAEKVKKKKISSEVFDQWFGRVRPEHVTYSIRVFCMFKKGHVDELIHGKTTSGFLGWCKDRLWPKLWFSTIAEELDGSKIPLEEIVQLMVLNCDLNHIHRPTLTFYSLPEGKSMVDLLAEYQAKKTGGSPEEVPVLDEIVV